MYFILPLPRRLCDVQKNSLWDFNESFRTCWQLDKEQMIRLWWSSVFTLNHPVIKSNFLCWWRPLSDTFCFLDCRPLIGPPLCLSRHVASDWSKSPLLGGTCFENAEVGPTWPTTELAWLPGKHGAPNSPALLWFCPQWTREGRLSSRGALR